MSFIKDGLARLVVEMVKREWPQQWPTFLPELIQLAQSGNTFQIEVTLLFLYNKSIRILFVSLAYNFTVNEFPRCQLVLLVLLRLTEDVVIFQSVDPSRRRDLHQSLTGKMKDIFDLLSALLEQQVNLGNVRLARSVLAVFQVLVDFVLIDHVNLIHSCYSTFITIIIVVSSIIV